jgi:lysophospholipase L1-like esterase
LVRNSLVQYVPLPYAFGDNYGPQPPWLDPLDILEEDETLIWRSKADFRVDYLHVFSPVWQERDRIALLRRFLPSIPEVFLGNPTWEVRLNSEGFRGSAMTRTHPGSTVRIACIGDSWTFGMPVTEDQTYPSRLEAWLREMQPGLEYEVQNFGVLGYSSFQGLRLLRTKVLDFDPDIIAIGFGMNDSQVAGYRDKDVRQDGAHPSIASRSIGALGAAVRDLETYKLLKYAALVVTFREKPIADYIRAETDKDTEGDARYETLDAWTRVSPTDYELNVREMIRLSREHGARVVLIDNELWEASPYRAVLKRLSAELHVPLVDGAALLDSARRAVEHNLESQLGLDDRGGQLPLASFPAAGKTTVVFRVYRGSADVPKGLSIVGADQQLGAFVPNLVTMHDDGTDGDQRAGDGVWSHTADLAVGSRVFYVYTNSGAPGRWEGLDVPYIRRVEVPASADGRPLHLPIETFGRVYLQGDHWHTDSAGYDAIAREAARVIATRD